MSSFQQQSLSVYIAISLDINWLALQALMIDTSAVTGHKQTSAKCEDLKMKSVEIACRVLSQNETVQFGIFGLIGKSEYFPPFLFLNEFFMKGNDPCDQDQRMLKWSAFELNFEEYETVRRWWLSEHPRAIKELPDVNCWADWVHEIIESI